MRPVKYYAGDDVYVEDRDPELRRSSTERTWAITKNNMTLNRDLE